MSPLNPKLISQPTLASSWKASGTSPGTVSRDRALKLAFETRPSPQPQVVSQFVKLVNGLPIPALLRTSTGKILTVNSKARVLMSGGKGSRPWHHESQLWQVLGWPPVPFRQWAWNGTLVSAWDCPLGESSETSHLTIRYLSQESPSDSEQQWQQERLALLGQEVLRVAHDLRQPLTSLEWFTTLLGKECQESQERTALVDHLVHAFRNLDGLLEHLLLFAKPVHVGRQPLRIKRLLDNVECSAIHPLRQKQITIHRTVEPGLDEVWGDEELLKRAVLNVVMNAIHASSYGGHIEIACQRVALEESAQRSSQAGWGVQLVIRDHGCGISSDDVQKIFDPFFSTRKGGTGLGLPIVKHILNAHHGLINVQSEHGRGTTVRLVLPQ